MTTRRPTWQPGQRSTSGITPGCGSAVAPSVSGVLDGRAGVDASGIADRAASRCRRQVGLARP